MNLILRKLFAWGSMIGAFAVIYFFTFPHYRQGESSLAGKSAENIQLTLADGQGTSAEIWLRAAEAKVVAAEPRPIPEPEMPMRKLRVLAVDDDALVLILGDAEDLSYEEIRGVLRLPITTLKIRVVRGRAMLRALVERTGVTS